MQNIKVYPAGFELNHSVPETAEEYNALAPNRQNAVLEDAVANVEYRGVFPEFRDALCDHIEADSGIERTNSGTEEKPVYESEGKYFARVQASKFAGNKEAFIAHYAAAAQTILDGIKFDPSVKERKSEGPKVGVNDLKLAKELMTRGEEKVAQVAAILSQKLGREVATDEKSIARAFADNRRAEAAKAAAAQKAELGL